MEKLSVLVALKINHKKKEKSKEKKFHKKQRPKVSEAKVAQPDLESRKKVSRASAK